MTPSRPLPTVPDRAASDEELRDLAQAQAEPARLGEILYRQGSITQPQLEHALSQQEPLHLPLGRTLVTLNYATDDTIRRAVAEQHQVPFVDLERMRVDRGLSRLINKMFARKHAVLPIALTGRALTVAMDNPADRATVDDLRRITRLEVAVVAATSRAMQRTFRRLYGEEEPVEDEPHTEVSIGVIESQVEVAEALVFDEQVIRRADEALRKLLGHALDERCSDLHLEMFSSSLRVRYRVDGVLREPQIGALQESLDRGAREIVSRIKILARLDIAERRRPQDGSFQLGVHRDGALAAVDLRVSVVPTYYGESVVIRVLDGSRAPKSIGDLSLSAATAQALTSALRRTTGIVLVTGPTGSGKSTTLYACLMNLHRPEIRILTAEDPVEYLYEGLSQCGVNQEIGNTFATYLRSFLRHDPEVIMVGEVRDEETAQMAFRAAQTGHLLLSTLHTNDAFSALPRLLDLRIDPSLIGSALVAVLSQRLVRRVCTQCSRPDRPDPDLVREFFGTDAPAMEFVRGVGCPACGFTGYRGRAIVADLWVPDSTDASLIIRRAPLEDIRVSAERTTLGMAEDAHARLRALETTLDELMRVLPYSAISAHRARYGTTVDDASIEAARRAQRPKVGRRSESR